MTEATTLVFVIGESIRSDFMHECHGPSLVRPIAGEALVACDVTSGSDSTHTSVPLLVSREMPGHPARVSNDATFLHAFKEVGFETHWYSVQGNTLVWADADYQDYPGVTTDTAALIPPLLRALSRPHPLKSIVLHAFNAHEPYCSRYDASKAPYLVSCKEAGGVPNLQSIDKVRLAYANAVDSSVGFLNDVITQLEKVPGQVFLAFTPDHGENLLDDNRNLYGHAMRHPTRWDTHVPAIFWANAAWRHSHPTQWIRLRTQINAPLMHADIVPTFLAAADINYTDTRQGPVNLLAKDVPRRSRIVQQSLGSVIDWQTLENEAQ